MNKLISQIKHLRFIVIFTSVFALVLVHLMMTFEEIRYTEQHIDDFIDKNASELETLLSDLDIFKINHFLFSLKDERINGLVLKSDFLKNLKYSDLIMGEMNSKSLFRVTGSVPVFFSGMTFATIEYQMDLLTMSKIVFSKNLEIYLLLVIMFSLMVILTNLSSLIIIRRIEMFILKIISLNKDSRQSTNLIKELRESERKISKSRLFSLNSNSFEQLIKTVQHLLDLEREQTSTKVQAKIAKQVAHDIRSPLTALNMLSSIAIGLPENQRVLMKKAVLRVNDIANSLLEKNSDLSSNSKEEHSYLLSSIIDSVITEKRLQFRDKTIIEITFEVNERSYGLFSKVNASSIKRAISNLINNSVEAIDDGPGLIEVKLYALNSRQNVIEIVDNGKGIPEEVIRKLGQEGLSVGKKGSQSGSGLGIFGTKEAIEEMSGSLLFSSKVGSGTSAKIMLPKTHPPRWFMDKIVLRSEGNIIIVDDDESVHKIWTERFSLLDFKGKLIHIHRPDEFKSNYTTLRSKESCLVLCDFEFAGTHESGLELIIDMGIEKSSVLITSHYEDDKIIKACEVGKIKLLPKNMVPFVPIIYELPRNF